MEVLIWFYMILVSALPVWSVATYGGFDRRTFEALHSRSVFYAGGRYVFDKSLNGTILENQMYVEQLTPIGGVKHPYPLIFAHGGGASGTVR